MSLRSSALTSFRASPHPEPLRHHNNLVREKRWLETSRVFRVRLMLSDGKSGPISAVTQLTVNGGY